MEPAYKNALPAKARELVDRIETFAQREVRVIVDPTRYVSPTDPNPTRPELDMSGGQARIFLPTTHFEPNGIVHELLHLERYWLEGIPQIVPVDRNAKNRWQFTSSIEGSLEHQVIVPREKSMGSILDHTGQRSSGLSGDGIRGRK